jgi:hypothetical protein
MQKQTGPNGAHDDKERIQLKPERSRQQGDERAQTGEHSAKDLLLCASGRRYHNASPSKKAL